MQERVFHVLMRELCDEMGIKMEKLSNDRILQLTKDGKVRHIDGNRFDINPQAGGRITGNKYDTYEVLKSQNVPIITHFQVFSPTLSPSKIDDGGIWPTIIAKFNECGCLVVKANTGSEGKEVFLCLTQKDLEIAVHKLLNKKRSISICPFYDIKTEYRTFYLNGKVYLIYGKIQPSVIGDGVTDLGTLIEGLNLPNRKVARDNVARMDLDYIPEKGEEILISWKHNLSGGAIPVVLDSDSELYSRIEEIAISAGKAMNMNFATVDVIHTYDDELMVMEINSGICTARFSEKIENGYELAKGIYREAVKCLFQ
ncbi:MAG: hypothetical protein IKG42_01285 [Clostridia bacterium]|nr:hypothetical protein [Clostridia bacterium]